MAPLDSHTQISGEMTRALRTRKKGKIYCRLLKPSTQITYIITTSSPDFKLLTQDRPFRIAIVSCAFSLFNPSRLYPEGLQQRALLFHHDFHPSCRAPRCKGYLRRKEASEPLLVTKPGTAVHTRYLPGPCQVRYPGGLPGGAWGVSPCLRLFVRRHQRPEWPRPSVAQPRGVPAGRGARSRPAPGPGPGRGGRGSAPAGRRTDTTRQLQPRGAGGSLPAPIPFSPFTCPRSAAAPADFVPAARPAPGGEVSASTSLLAPAAAPLPLPAPSVPPSRRGWRRRPDPAPRLLRPGPG